MQEFLSFVKSLLCTGYNKFLAAKAGIGTGAAIHHFDQSNSEHPPPLDLHRPIKFVMKKIKFTLMCAAVSFACSQSGICAYLVGSVDPGSPASESAETGYITTLLGMSANQTVNSGGKEYRTFAYDASVVSLTDYLKFDPPSSTASITGYQFVLGKFGNESWVWELTAGETFVIPQTYSDQDNKGGGISHYSVFNRGTTTTRVPDGGTSIALLGMALIGLGGVRKVLGKR